MPKEIVRPIPEKASGQFDPAGPDIMDALKQNGTMRFSPSSTLRDFFNPPRHSINYGRYE